MDDEGRRLAAAIEARLGAYVPDQPAAQLRLVPLDTRRRATTRLDRYAIDGPAGRTLILAKTYLAAGPTEPSRPRLAPIVPAASRAALEHRALSAVAAAIGTADPDRLAAIPTWDLLDDQTIVMGVLPWPSLDRVLARRRLRGRFAGPPPEPAVVEAFRNAGRWLARFRDLALPTDGSRLATRDDVLAALLEFGRHLGAAPGGPTRNDLARALSAAEAVLPAVLPAAPGHGDFAMRNVLVDPAGRVAVLDTRARWSVPVEEDLATLLVALRTNRLQSATQGLAWSDRTIERYKAALLDGAAYDPAARPVLRVFELLVLWDKWAAHRARDEGRPRSLGSRLTSAAVERQFRTTTAGILRAL
jgi:hypothetical protein